MLPLDQNEIQARVGALTTAERDWLHGLTAQLILGDASLGERHPCPTSPNLSLVIDGGLYVRVRRKKAGDVRLGRLLDLMELLPASIRLSVMERIWDQAFRYCLKPSQKIGCYLLFASVAALGGLVGHLLFLLSASP
jgi:hypothetical protein